MIGDLCMRLFPKSGAKLTILNYMSSIYLEQICNAYNCVCVWCRDKPLLRQTMAVGFF